MVILDSHRGAVRDAVLLTKAMVGESNLNRVFPDENNLSFTTMISSGWNRTISTGACSEWRSFTWCSGKSVCILHAKTFNLARFSEKLKKRLRA